MKLGVATVSGEVNAWNIPNETDESDKANILLVQQPAKPLKVHSIITFLGESHFVLMHINADLV